MRALAVLTEELESRPADADRVDALARHLRAVGRDAGALAGEWLVAGARSPRPARLTQAALAEAARALAAEQGMAPWLFDAGRAAAGESAEAIALLLPWPDHAPTPASRPALADWLAGWAAAAARPAPERAGAIARSIARLDDAIARRWAARAACGQVRPLVDGWQWQRAWARAFDADPQEVAWWWQRRREVLRLATPAPVLPRPRGFAPLEEAHDGLHADLLAAWRCGELQAEPRWPGVRVHVARRGDEVAVWQRSGRLLNDAVPAHWLQPGRWPEDAVIEAVLLACRGGRVVALSLEARKGVAADTSLHLALVDWHGTPEEPRARRARLLERWPAADAAPPLPSVFTAPRLAPPGAVGADLAQAARAARDAGWSGLVLRHARSGAAWAVRAPLRRVRAVLQYVPGDALAAGTAAASALAFVDSGFALWSRVPLSEQEQRAAMAASLAGEFIAAPDGASGVEGLRLLPLARMPIALPQAELLRLHDWLRAHVGTRFGGVHAVAPEQVFEIGFAEARPSRRHRIGATLAGARVLRWVPDAPPGAAQLASDLFAAD